MSISNNENKAAHKILCIGGSTFNTGTPEKIKDALVKTNFLQEWAVVFVNHLYFRLYNKQKYKDKIHQDWQGVNINCVDEIGDHPININTVYILPDSWCVQEEEFRDADCIEQNGQVILQVLQPQSSYQKTNQWWNQNPYDAGQNERIYTPCIDKFMEELVDVKIKIKNLTIAGLILCGLDGDGAYGLKAIKDKGGKTAVQNPGECSRTKEGINTESTVQNPGEDSHPEEGINTRSMPDIALDQEQKHQKISIEGESSIMSLTEWLQSIRYGNTT